jgi:hypothetical protein
LHSGKIMLAGCPHCCGCRCIAIHVDVPKAQSEVAGLLVKETKPSACHERANTCRCPNEQWCVEWVHVSTMGETPEWSCVRSIHLSFESQ